jgi:hypothetical protein
MTSFARLARFVLAFTSLALPAAAQLGYKVAPMPGEVTRDPSVYGPYNVNVLAGGVGLVKPIVDYDSVTSATSAWSLHGWVNSAGPADATQLIAGLGEATDSDSRYLGTVHGKLMLRMGEQNILTSSAELAPGAWHFVAASFDGQRATLYMDGKQVAQGAMLLGRVRPVLEFAPAFPNRAQPAVQLGWASGQHFGMSDESISEAWFPPNPLGTSATHFGGTLAGWTLTRTSLSAEALHALSSHAPEFATLVYEDASKPWPFQTRDQAGYRAPQDPSTLPHSAAPFSAPVATPATVATRMVPAGDNSWLLRGGWTLAVAPKVSASGDAISQPGFHSSGWMAATVPGTVLTTMVDRGVYPDPDYGLNNMAIPEDLNKQDYWYRIEFASPANAHGHRFCLTFEGINYAAEVWLNGRRVGDVRGAFLRGQFDVTSLLKTDGANALAVRISPPPHPGIPNEQSIRGGPGENGGSMLLDGPTFVATEGWDWVPAIRDRDTGIWQDVVLTATDSVSLGDPQVITRLPLPATDSATVSIAVPLINSSQSSVSGTLNASFEGVAVAKQVTLKPGETILQLTPAEFSQLRVAHPRLWWPNGYGKPELYHLKLTFSGSEGESDARELRFGIREITYELSLFDRRGDLRRMAVTPAEAAGDSAALVDVTRPGIREIPTGWAYSLADGADNSAAVQPIDEKADLTQLVVRVNGVRIAARGGNWGMDDARKRVDRAHLEPFFRLHRDANLNIIRNWVGQSTEQTFYDLADEYGLMVWNDFWESTQDYNIEAQDPDLFLKNAADVIRRFRNHPSILLWCGRNEGVPQPILNQGLDQLVRTLDGTRFYAPSSNAVDLQVSGPYHYQDPTRYYTLLNRGFSVETGTASMPTLESFRSFIPAADQWPISDDWAYHDWHASGNGDTAPFIENMERMFGAATSLEDFERKAQMMNYVDHRAIFEGFNAHLWSPNSGRMLWMTQPAWPSTMWQILSSDYDTQASFFGVKKACEPVHVQLDLSNNHVDVVNTSNNSADNLKLTASLYDISGKLVATHFLAVSAPSDKESDVMELAPLQWPSQGVLFAQLELKDASGNMLSRNFYWLAQQETSLRALSSMPTANVDMTAVASRTAGEDGRVTATLTNRGSGIALAAKLTLLDANGKERVLPAYYSDNYVSLLPGESETVTIDYPLAANGKGITLGLRGWNIAPTTASASTK